MDSKEIDIWVNKFLQDIIIKNAIILSGNVDDLVYNSAEGRYESVLNHIIYHLNDKNYEHIVVWDRALGIDKKLSKNIPETATTDNNDSQNNDNDDIFDNMGGDETTADTPSYDDPKDFLAYVEQAVTTNNEGQVFILNYTDYLFGNTANLTELERVELTRLDKALGNQPYDIETTDFNNRRNNLIIILTKKNGAIPPSFYTNNPQVSTIDIPMPGRNERVAFLENNPNFHVSEDISGNTKASIINRDNFIDRMDGLTLKQISQILKLSNNQDQILSCEKLVNLYRFGESSSPWEDLSFEKVSHLREILKKRVKGQDQAIERVNACIIRAVTGLSGLQHSAKQHKPKGSLFFVGPTGVGKTELAKALAEFLFGDESACIRFDMSEFNHEQSDQRLVGAPPGYVGYEEGGQLTNQVKAKPFCVLLFDEIEKAHERILDKFLQILEDGRLTDGKGETVSFSETFILFTSNIGAATVDPNQSEDVIAKQFFEQVKEHFININRPELLNRIGDTNIVPFNFINDTNVFTAIAKTKFGPIKKAVKERYEVDLVFDDEELAFKTISEKANIANGGRGLGNKIEECLLDPLCQFIFLHHQELSGQTIVISIENKMLARFGFAFQDHL